MYQKVVILTSCVALGAAASSGIVNHDAQQRSDANACALKSFLIVIAQRTKDSPRPAPGAAKIIPKYKRLVAVLQPPIKDCPAKYIIK